MKKLLPILVALVLACACGLCLYGCGSDDTEEGDNGTEAESTDSETEAEVTDTAEGEYSSGKHHAVVAVEGYDAFTITLNADAAPLTVQYFCNLANSGFYNGTTFHRIVEGFCLQGGDPTGTGAGGSDTTVKGEFSQNGVENALADDFQRGTVAMARKGYDNDSADGQFFVTLASSETVSLSLNGQYGAFGTIGENGMAIVDQIVADYLAKADSANSGTIADKADQPVINSITIID